MKKLFSMMAVVLLTMFGSMTANAEDITIWEGSLVPQWDGTKSPFCLSDGGTELVNAKAEAGDVLKFFITPTEQGIAGGWQLWLTEGHWKGSYAQFKSWENPLTDEGCALLPLTADDLAKMTTPGGWGGVFVLQGNDCTLTKIVLYKEGEPETPAEADFLEEELAISADGPHVVSTEFDKYDDALKVNINIVNGSGASRAGWGLGFINNIDDYTGSATSTNIELKGKDGDKWTQVVTIGDLKKAAKKGTDSYVAGQWHAEGGISWTIWGGCSIESFMVQVPNPNVLFKGEQALEGGKLLLAKPDQTANWQVGDIIKITASFDNWGTGYLVDNDGVQLSGYQEFDGKTMKVGITKKMLEKIQAGGLAFSGNGDNFKVKKVVRLEGSGDEDACWLGNKALTNGPVYLAVPAYEFEDADIAVGDVINLNFSDAITVNQISTPSELFGPYDPERYVTVGQTVKIKILKDSELATLKKNGFYGYANVTGGNLISIIVAPTLGATSFDFNKVKIATSNNSSAGDIIPENLDGATELVIVDGESNATMTIAPNLKQGDFPEEAFARSCFWSTLAGPQLRLTGGYTGMTVKVESANAFNKLAFSQTNFSISTVADKGVLDVKNGEWSAGEGVTVNDVTFTLKADTTEIWKDGKLQEVILNDMGQWWINKIEVDPISDVVIDAADGAELGTLVATEMAKYAKPKTLTINLAAGGNYTTTQTIEATIPVTINGNGATVDASALKTPFFQMPAGSDITEMGEINFSGLTVTGLPYQFFYCNKVKCVVSAITVDNCVIGVNGTNKKTIFDFNGGGLPEKLSISNSTIWANPSNAQNGGFFSTQSGSKMAELGIESCVISITNSTLYNIANGKTVSTLRQNSQSGQKYIVKDNIVVNCGKKNEFYVGLNAGQAGKAENWEIANNSINWGGADVNADEATKCKNATIEKAVDGTVAFANADNGDFTLGDCAQKTAGIGDPRWLGGKGAGEVTGIENVKNATVEDGAWYTVSGQRVAQPTKGLYIHNGKKVVIK